MRKLILWLAPPKFDNLLDTQATQLLYYLLWLLFTSFVVIRLVAFVAPGVVAVDVANIVLIFFIPLFVFGLQFLRVGRYRIVAWFLIFALITLAIWLTLTTRGILSPYPTTFILPILIAGFIVSVRDGIAVSVIAIVFTTYMLYTNLEGITPEADPTNALASYMISNWIVYIITYLIGTFLVIYAQNMILRTLTQLADRNQVLETEIVARKQAEEDLRNSEMMFRMLTENALNAIFIIRNRGGWEFAYVSPAVKQIIGYEPENLMSNMGVLDIFQAGDHERIERLLSATLSGSIQLLPTRYVMLHKNGSKRHVRVLPVPITYMGEKVLIGTAVDVTAEYEAEKARIDLEVQQQYINFLKDFMGTMSHDIKTPLNIINTSIYIAQKTEDEDRKQRKFDKIIEQVMLISSIVDDILTITHLDTIPTLNLVPTDLNDCLLQVHKQLLPRIEAKNLTVTFGLAEELTRIQAVSGELTRALTNLIENAINYTPEGGSITIGTRQAEERVLLEIQDTGIGIPAEDLPYIYDPFRRAENTKGKFVGTGLGLAIVDRILKLHGANVDLTSEIGVGTRFTIHFSAT